MRYEKFWNSLFDWRSEAAIWRKIENGEWYYLFEYEDKEFDYGSTTLDGAFCKFLDDSWGTHFDKYLANLGFKDMNIDALDDLKEEQEGDYCLLRQKLGMDQYFKLKFGGMRIKHLVVWPKKLVLRISGNSAYQVII
ncbi:hypothetical protein NWO25_18835 [Enterococcus lactis]|nr:hypothetical protein [Enterococcus lactis]